MLSRVADSVFWMSRYIERAESVARFIDVNYNLTLDLEDEHHQQWAPLVATTGDADTFYERYRNASRENVLIFLTFDTENPNSIFSCLSQARENARTIRESISSDMWEELNKFYMMVRDAANTHTLEDPWDLLNKVKLNCHLLMGITDTTMSHGEAWHFSRMGRLLERADKTSRILDVKYYILLPEPNTVGTPQDIVQWSALLKSASALEMYRKCHGRISPSKVADFLILNAEFPRSIRFCLVEAEESLRAITGTAVGHFRNRAEQQVGRLRAELDYTDINDVISQGMHEFIDGFQNKLNQVGDAIFETFVNTKSKPKPLQTQLQ